MYTVYTGTYTNKVGNIIEAKTKGSDLMYKVKINNAFVTYGLISVNIKKEGNQLVTEGMFKTHLYIEEIDSLECDRFKVTGIDVKSESFGSTDPFIVYYFVFDDIETYYEDLEYTEEELVELYKTDI